jgi:hypothetical protein
MNVRRVFAVVVAAAAIAAAVAGGAWADSGTVTAVCGVGGQAQPPPCDSEWYTSPVSVVWNISGTPAQTPSGCQDAVYNTDQVTPLACAVSWLGGATTTLSFTLHVELSTPTATATPDRPPDVNGWYNHPVAVSLAGTAFSGIASCTPVQTYGGPATSSTALAGTCTDNAGKVANASFPFRYDATPPGLTVTSEPADRLAGLSWHASAGPAPLAWVQVTRKPGLKRAASSVLYTGDAQTGYQDHQVRNGTSYTYMITAADQAGNVTQRTVKIRPGVRLLAPASGARLKNPPTLRWTAIPTASYYNVQLFRGSKILSAWPTRASLKLARSWSFGGRRHRLAPGRYHWYVWPGYGPQRNAHYGHAVGNATFVIR